MSAEGPPQPPPNPFPRNPGTVEDLHRQCQSVFPMFFEGAKLLFNKGLSNNFQVSHTMSLSNSSPAGYRFGATFLGSNMVSPTEVYPLLLADINLDGDLNANIVQSFGKRLRCKFISQIEKSKFNSVQMTADYRGDLYTASLTLGNPDFIHGTGVAVMHYLRALSPSLTLGADLTYQCSPQLPGGHMAVMSILGKYTTPGGLVGALSIGNSGTLHVSAYQKCSDSLQIGAELDTNFKMGESTATVGYEVQLDKGEFMLRGCVDTDLVVKSTIEKKLSPLPFTVALCSMINHRKNAYQFGCGLIVG